MTLALPRQDIAAGLLALAVHGFFLLLLVFGLSWQMQEPQPIMAELWQALPEPPPPAPAPEPMPEPEPEPIPVPEIKADIALEKQKQEEQRKQKAALELEKKREEEKRLKQKQALEQEQRAKEEKKRRDDARRMDLELAREAAQIEAKRDEDRKLAEQRRREALRREEEAMQRQMLEESLAGEAAQLKAKAAADQRAAEVARVVARYKDMIGAKVRGNTRLPDGLTGNPEVEFRVSVLPTGEIASLSMTKSSGNPAFDQAVQRGIEKSSPLPLPADKSAAAEFRSLLLKHKARE